MPQRDVRTIARALRKDCFLETREIRDGAKSRLLSDGLLVPAGTMQYWPTEDGEMPIFYNAGKLCYADYVGMHTLSKSDVQLWKADFQAVAKRMAECFECQERMDEIKAGCLMRLGISSIPIGRRSCRTVYFANTAANVDDYLRYHIREKDDFILIAGYTDNIFFNDERTNRVFKMEDVIIADDTKRWGVRKDILDSRFKQPTQPSIRKKRTAKQEKLDEIAIELKKLCFDYRHKYTDLLELRKSLRTQKGMCGTFNLSTSTLNDYLGGQARDNGENPVVFFWWDTLLDRNDKYQMFEEFLDREEVRSDIPKYMNMRADTLKEKIEKYMAAKMIKLNERRNRK